MIRLHVVGRKNHGKTTLVVALVEELTRRGVQVGSMKHSPHVHELDRPGKDSHRHRQAGAEPSAIVTQDSIGVFLRRGAETDVYAKLDPLFAGVDVLLVEGDLQHPGRKIEVWRAALGGSCLAAENESIVAVVSDDPAEVAVPVWPRRDVAALADRIVAMLPEGPGAVSLSE